MGAGNGENQVNQHAAVERQFADGLRFDDFADARVGCPEDLAARRNFHVLGQTADFQADFNGYFLRNLQPQRLRIRPKTGRLGSYFIIIWQKRRHVEEAVLVRHRPADSACRRGGQLDGRSHNRQMLRIRHRPCKSPIIALAREGQRKP